MKLTAAQKDEIRQHLAEGKLSLSEIGRRYGVNHGSLRFYLPERQAARDARDRTNARILDLWKSGGMSAAQIAAEVGSVSRNAVIGVIYRAGLTRTDPRRASVRRSRPKTNTFVNAVSVAHNRVARKFDPGLKPEKAAAQAPQPLLVPLLELRYRQCKFPIGDPADKSFAFCGHHTAEEKSYCDYHDGICHVKPAPRQRAA